MKMHPETVILSNHVIKFLQSPRVCHNAYSRPDILILIKDRWL